MISPAVPAAASTAVPTAASGTDGAGSGLTEADGLLWGPPTVDVTMVVPYYNPGPRVRDTVDRLAATLGRRGGTFEIIAVSDGSTDGSEHCLAGSVARSVRLPRNQGKGQALRVGFSMSRGRLVGFIDADGDLPAEQVAAFVAAAEAGADVVIGSKRHPGSELAFPLLRRFYSRAWQQLVRMLFQLKARDTQTGVKLFRRQVLADILPLAGETGFALDLELLVLADRLGYRGLVELPVHIVERQVSTVSARSAVRMLADLFGIFLRLQLPPFHHLPPPVPVAAQSVLAQPARLVAPVAAQSVLAQSARPVAPVAARPVAARPVAARPVAAQPVARPVPPVRDPVEVAVAVARSEARFAGADPFDSAELVLAGRP
ncbi:MAG TPA: glycosyltransferase [Acidimicrobiales bacterium]|nr:glycosyltransferase [Acidimicrobiales bacterium]